MSYCNKMSENPKLAERFKIFNNIDDFRPFQIEVFEKLAEYKKICIVTSSGSGKTTLIKYLSFDFIDLNENDKIIIFVNTRILSLDIESSMLEILDDNEKSMICNLCKYDKDNQIRAENINLAKIFISTPGKYHILHNKIGINFKFVCVDEIDILLDNKNDVENSDILNILKIIKYEYIFISTATINDSVYKHILDKYDIKSKIFDSKAPIIKYHKLQFKRKDKDWYQLICDKIYYILECNPLHKKSIVFCNYKDDCYKLYNEYSASSKEKYCFNGDYSTKELEDTLYNYKEYGIILFTTDMSQRGINIPDIENVFHIGVTNEENFYHRNGRSLRKVDCISNCYMFYDINSIDNSILKDISELKLE